MKVKYTVWEPDSSISWDENNGFLLVRTTHPYPVISRYP